MPIGSFIALCICAVIWIPTAAMSDAIELTVEGVRNSQGRIHASICGDKLCYERHKGFLEEKIFAAKAGDTTVRFEGLAPGEYAIVMFHDENGDGRFDKNFIGFPQEGFGISNDVKPVFSQPDWERAALTVKGEVLRTSIRVQYW